MKIYKNKPLPIIAIVLGLCSFISSVMQSMDQKLLSEAKKQITTIEKKLKEYSTWSDENNGELRFSVNSSLVTNEINLCKIAIKKIEEQPNTNDNKLEEVLRNKLKITENCFQNFQEKFGPLQLKTSASEAHNAQDSFVNAQKIEAGAYLIGSGVLGIVLGYTSLWLGNTHGFLAAIASGLASGAICKTVQSVHTASVLNSSSPSKNNIMLGTCAASTSLGFLIGHYDQLLPLISIVPLASTWVA